MKTLLCAQYMWGTLKPDEWVNNFDYIYILLMLKSISDHLQETHGNKIVCLKLYKLKIDRSPLTLNLWQ